MNVYIDNRELKRISAGKKYFEKYNPVIVHLMYGDYVFYDNGISVAFEYKTIADFINSINDNRVFNQALNQSNNFDYHFVIIVGNEKETSEAIREHGRQTGRYMSNRQLNGSIASLVNFTSVLQVKNESLAFDLMERVALKCLDDKPVIKRFPKSRGSPAYRLLVNNIEGIGEKTALRICDVLGLDSVSSVFGLDLDLLCSVEGIGERKACRILEQLKGCF